MPHCNDTLRAGRMSCLDCYIPTSDFSTSLSFFNNTLSTANFNLLFSNRYRVYLVHGAFVGGMPVCPSPAGGPGRCVGGGIVPAGGGILDV